jgi:Tol biopolymer transport system component
MRVTIFLLLSLLILVQIVPALAEESTNAVTAEQSPNEVSIQSAGTAGTAVAISSRATNMVPRDTNQASDVFWINRDTGQVRSRILAWNGLQPNGYTYGATLSANGHYMAFSSDASNLVAGDAPLNIFGDAEADIFIAGDSSTGGKIVRIAKTDGGSPAKLCESPSLSGDGRYVAFTGTDDLLSYFDVLIGDRTTGRVVGKVVSGSGAEPDGEDFHPSMSSNGLYVALVSSSTNLVRGDTNGYYDLFVASRSSGRIQTRIMTSSGAQPDGDMYDPSIDSAGRFIAFASTANNLVPGDSGGYTDIFVADRTTGKVVKKIATSSGAAPNDNSYDPSIDAAGRYIAFVSLADNLVAGDTNERYDIFIADRTTGRVTKRIAAWNGAQPNGGSDSPSISPDGRYVTFCSAATNLVSGDTNGSGDAFIADATTGKVLRRVVAYNGAEPNGESS